MASKIMQMTKIKAYKPLKQLEFKTRRITDSLYAIVDAPGMYLGVSDENQSFEKDVNAPLAIVLFWAESEAAIRHCVLSENVQESDSNGVQPPAELLLAPECLTYGAILKAAGSGTFGRHMERADYRLPENYFLHRIITVGSHHSFYFRSSEDDMNEKVYAIGYRLPD